MEVPAIPALAVIRHSCLRCNAILHQAIRHSVILGHIAYCYELYRPAKYESIPSAMPFTILAWYSYDAMFRSSVGFVI